jgi:hypothetical protein
VAAAVGGGGALSDLCAVCGALLPLSYHCATCGCAPAKGAFPSRAELELKVLCNTCIRVVVAKIPPPFVPAESDSKMQCTALRFVVCAQSPPRSPAAQGSEDLSEHRSKDSSGRGTGLGSAGEGPDWAQRTNQLTPLYRYTVGATCMQHARVHSTHARPRVCTRCPDVREPDIQEGHRLGRAGHPCAGAGCRVGVGWGNEDRGGDTGSYKRPPALH